MTASHYAVVFTEKERAELQADAGPGPVVGNEVLGRTIVSLISPGTELACYRGQLTGGKFPMRPGYAAVFEVQEVGPEVQTLRPGDLAFCMGNHRSWQKVAEIDAVKLPSGLSPQTAVFTRLMGVSMATLVTTTARPPDRVLVMGLGIVGHLAAKLFAACGYQVIACDPSPARRAKAVAGGIANVLTAAPLDDPAVAGKVALCLDCSGHEQAVLDGCRIVRRRGEVVLTGVPWVRRSDVYAHDVLHAVFHKYVILRSGWEWELPLHAADFRTGDLFENYAAGMRWLADGRVRVDGLAAVRSPRQAQECYQQLMSGKTDDLSFVFDWAQCP